MTLVLCILKYLNFTTTLKKITSVYKNSFMHILYYVKEKFCMPLTYIHELLEESISTPLHLVYTCIPVTAK